MIGVILAGGQSSRMGGGDKGLLELGGRSLLSHVIARLDAQVDKMAINANGDPSRFADYGLPIFADSVPDFAGPLAGILAAMDYAADQGGEKVITVAADTPFFPDTLVAHLLATARDEKTSLALAATTEDGRLARHPTFGLWSVDLREDLRAALADGVRKVVQWTGPHGCAYAQFDNTPFDPFFNVNTPDDMERAKDIYKKYTP